MKNKNCKLDFISYIENAKMFDEILLKCCDRRGQRDVNLIDLVKSFPTNVRDVNLIDLVKSFPTNVYLQKSASTQLRTSLSKFI